MKISKSFRKSQRVIIRAAIQNSRLDLPMPGLNKIRVRSTTNKHFEGWAYVNDKNNAEISINRKISGAKLFSVVAHEMTHVSQFLRGDLESLEDGFKWKGQVFKYSDKAFKKMNYEKYRALPWETEAYDYCERVI